MFWVFWKHYLEDGTSPPAPVAAPARQHNPPAPPPRSFSYRSFSSDAASVLAAHGSDAAIVLDDELYCHELTENWERISGFTAAEDAGEEFKTHIAPDHVRRVSQYLAQGNYETPLRFQLKHADGRWVWCELTCLETEARGRYASILRDVTALTGAQGQLEKTKLEADLAIRSRSEFLANMSHELRTPLNAILGFAQMIESGTYGDIGHPKYHDYIGSIQESGTTLLSKINDLLEIANIDSGQLVLNEAEVDLGALIRQAIEFHSHRAFSGQVSLRQHVPIQPLRVLGDRIRLLQVLTNLISNAIKYTPPGGTVDIACDIRRDGGINIVIEDNGGGIPPTQLQNILSAFKQDNSFFARSRDCVGLGLALSKEIVKLHHGRIDIESAQEKGTHLTIHLPKERTLKLVQAKKVDANVVLSVS